MKNLFRFLLCTLLLAPGAALALDDGWVSLGGGWYNGEDYDDDPAADDDEDAASADGAALHLSINRGGPVLLRLRASWLLDYTSNTAEEVAGMVGIPLGADRNTWLAAGVSRLTDVSAEQQSPTLGVPVEIIWYPVRGLELALQGNFNDDSNFIGIAIGGAIGRQRPK